MWKADWKWHLVMVVQLLVFLHGVEMQQQQQPAQRFQQQQREIGSERKPQIYWATSINSNNNRRIQQANDWDAVAQKNYIDRQWGVPVPVPAPNPPPTTSAPYSPPAPPATAPPSAPVYAPPPAPIYTPPPAPVYAPAPTSPPYQPYPPAYPEPAPPAYPEPAPPAYPEQAPAYNPPPPPAYDQPSYGPPQSPAGQYYYYIPVQETKEKGPSIKDMLEKDKEALSALLPDHKDNLTNEQKIWLSVLTPLIVVALVVPLAAILFSSFTVTTNGRKFGELNMSDMKKSLRDIVESYGSVLETDECMQRIICDLGSYAKDVPGNSLVLTFLSTLVPDTMKNNMAIFTKAATYGAEKAQCNSFKCSAWKY